MPSSKFVFVSYTHEDRDRIAPLVDLLRERLQGIGGSIYWDQDLRAGAAINEVTHKLLAEAACVLVMWTTASVSSVWVHGECERARQDCRLVPILVDENADVRAPFNVLNNKPLRLPPRDGADDFEQIWEMIQDLVERGGGTSNSGTLSDNQWVIRRSREASVKLRHLTSHFRSINEVLIANTPPVEDLRGALKQVMNTYRVTRKAVQRFIAPAATPGAIDPQPYIELAHGDLEQEIESGRGHCGRILVHYSRVGGVRDAIKNRLSRDQLREVDQTFKALGTADGDAFEDMTRIAFHLRDESRAIENSLLARQEKIARERIVQARMLLEPLENELSGAMREMQQLEASLGNATL